MKWSWRLGRFAGIDVYVHATFLILIAWLVLTEWQQTHSTRAVVGAVLFILSLFACVVIHEFGHALAARHSGIATRDIILLPIGGVSRMERIPDNPRQELWIALAGPLVSLAVAAALWFFLWAVHAPAPMNQMVQLDSWAKIYPFVAQLMVANGVLAVFNLLPAFPMDGGRIFRAVLARRMDYSRATRVAANIGQGMAVIFALAGIIGNPFLVLVALFIWIGAGQEAALAEMKTALEGIRVSQVTVTDFKTISPSDTLAHAVQLMLHGSQQDFPVVDAGRLVGILTRRELLKALSKSGPDSSVSNAMRKEYPIVSSSDALQTAMEKLQDPECRVLPVMEAGRLVGLFTLENLGEFVLVQSALSSPIIASTQQTQRTSPDRDGPRHSLFIA